VLVRDVQQREAASQATAEAEALLPLPPSRQEAMSARATSVFDPELRRLDVEFRRVERRTAGAVIESESKR
jgi:hypothetical protein